MECNGRGLKIRKAPPDHEWSKYQIAYDLNGTPTVRCKWCPAIKPTHDIVTEAKKEGKVTV